MNTPDNATVHVREARRSDASAIADLHRRNHLGDLDVADWYETWAGYPLRAHFDGVPIGWVLEAPTGVIGGYLGAVHMLYELGGKPLKALIASAWVVDEAFRGKAMQLMTTFYRQKQVDLWINGSANPIASQVLTALRIPRIPIPDYATPCFWAARPRAFARAALKRRGISAASLLAYPAGMALLLRDAFLLGRHAPSSTIQSVPAFDGRFDSFWERLRTGNSRMRAVRTSAVLEWRFGKGIRTGTTTVLCADRNGELAGYVVLVRRAGDEHGMSMYDVADLQAIGDDAGVYRDLLLAARRLARRNGIDAVKFMTGTPPKRVAAEALRPYTYHLGLWQLYYRTAKPELTAQLSAADAWDFSLFETY